MRKTVKALIVVLMLVAVTFLPVTSIQAQVYPAELLFISDKGEPNEDVNNNNYKSLVFIFNLNVNQSGRYRVSGSLIFMGARIGSATTTENLDQGQGDLLLKFNSSLIFKTGRDGVFEVVYSIKFENENPFNDSSYTTKTTYRYKDFDDPDNWPVTPDRFKPSAFKEGDRIVLKNEFMTVWFYYKITKFVWFYTVDNKSTTKFFCDYTKIHGFPWQTSEWFGSTISAFSGDIDDERRGVIKESGPITGRNKNYGEFVSYSVFYPDIPIIYVSSGEVEFQANLTISVLLAAGDNDVKIGEKTYSVSGGTQMKISFDIKFNNPIGVNGIALEHDIWSESKKGYHHDFQLQAASPTLVERESIDDSEKRFETFYKEPQRINFMPKYSKPQLGEGQYLWSSNAYVDGVSSLAPMTYSYQPKTKHLRLYLASVTGGLSISRVQTDSVLGLVDGSAPNEKNFIPPEPPTPPSILVTFAGWISAVCLVILPLWVDFRRQRKRRERELLEFEEELEEEYGE